MLLETPSPIRPSPRFPRLPQALSADSSLSHLAELSATQPKVTDSSSWPPLSTLASPPLPSTPSIPRAV